ncbi:hypothetical protein [Microbacterium ulmi]|uniref:BMP family ABC transporter substrate-binding protein n=1 Tax=Microbacterium ulmi TaxID=179095 RepID=A0A7Y2Q1G9_9MICO|nr:hypothetical protein [Microbacterium ulmi]NII68927.1 hypothetical protein [Microbacterium ulmi]NNH03910.1 hypothetical protein [Microbacterium ulmi]
MHSRQRTIAALLTAALAAVLLAGCAGDDWAGPRPAPTPIGALGVGFEPAAEPSPEATIEPAAGSWDDVHPSPGYRVVLLTAGDDAPTKTLVTAIREWAGDEKVDLRTVEADDDLIAGIVTAMDMNPDLIISAGNDLIDPLATVSANHLDRHFLVVGAEVAEPTYNVTAVDWTGASFRGEGLGTPSDYDPATFTPERSAEAVRAGVAAVLHGLTGLVIWID